MTGLVRAVVLLRATPGWLEARCATAHFSQPILHTRHTLTPHTHPHNHLATPAGVKTNGNKNFIVVDGSMTELIRPSL